MKLFIALVSYNKKVREEFIEKKSSLFTVETAALLRDNNIQTSFGYFNTEKPNNKIDEYFLAATKDVDYVLAIVEEEIRPILSPIQNGLFWGAIETLGDEVNLANHLKPIFQRLITNFLRLIKKMESGENQNAMLLPFGNFNSNELLELAAVCKARNLQKTFENELGVATTALQKRKKPRRNSSRSTKYFIDGNDKHFIYGPETHSSIATGAPHEAYCEFNGTFRFGKRIPTDRHFNVSKGRGDDTKIAGTFPNCHGEDIVVQKQTHINMFANDHH